MLVVSNSNKCNLNKFNHKTHINKTPFECILSSLPNVSKGTYVCFSKEDNTYDLTKHARFMMSKINQNGIFQANYEDSLVGNHLTKDVLKLVDCDYPFYWINRIPKPELLTIASNPQTIAIARQVYQLINLVSCKSQTYHRNYHFLEQSDECGTKAKRNQKPDTNMEPYKNPLSPRKIEKQRIALFVVLLLKAGIIDAWPYLDGDQRMFDFIRGRFDKDCAGMTFQEYHTRKNVHHVLPSLEFFKVLYPSFDFDCYRYQTCSVVQQSDLEIAIKYFASSKAVSESNSDIVRHYRFDKKHVAKEKENYRLEKAITTAGYYKNTSDNIEKRFKKLLYFKRMSDDELLEYRTALNKIRSDQQSLLIALKKKDIFINRIHAYLSLDKNTAQKQLLEIENELNQIRLELANNKKQLDQSITKQTKINTKLKLSLANASKQSEDIKSLKLDIDQLMIEKNKLTQEKQSAISNVNRLKKEKTELNNELIKSTNEYHQSQSDVQKLVKLSKEHKTIIHELEHQIDSLQERLERSRPVKHTKNQLEVLEKQTEITPQHKPRRQRVRRVPRRRKSKN